MALTDTQRAFLAGLLVGEGSFKYYGKSAVCDLKMSARHEHLLRLVHSWMPFTSFYGPYANPYDPNRVKSTRFYLVRWKGPVLVQLIKELDPFGLEDYCPHVHSRVLRVKRWLDIT
jgi:hypothetical protein